MNLGHYEAKILADSITSGVRLTTLVVRLPRIVLAELNTHRMLSRNSASSRAIPVEKRIQAVMDDPFVPDAFGANKKGMQAGERLDDAAQEAARLDWLIARNFAVKQARALVANNVHKQWANRLVEPFSWTEVIITATEWSNFFALRISSESQPEIRRAAENMKAAMDASTPRELKVGAWHLPLVPDYADLTAGQVGYSEEDIAHISCGRCARVSYLTHGGVRDPSADLDLAARLLADGHMSPFEHAAVVGQCIPAYGMFTHGEYAYTEWNLGNFRAPWIQYRKLIPNEADFSKRGAR